MRTATTLGWPPCPASPSSACSRMFQATAFSVRTATALGWPSAWLHLPLLALGVMLPECSRVWLGGGPGEASEHEELLPGSGRGSVWNKVWRPVSRKRDLRRKRARGNRRGCKARLRGAKELFHIGARERPVPGRVCSHNKQAPPSSLPRWKLQGVMATADGELFMRLGREVFHIGSPGIFPEFKNNFRIKNNTFPQK